jgi:hypothetical protein
MKVIAYTLNEQLVIIYPTNFLPIKEVAKKDVPHGIPYKILDITDLPSNSLFRDAWELDISEPDGYGANYGYGGQYKVIGYTNNFEPIIGIK